MGGRKMRGWRAFALLGGFALCSCAPHPEPSAAPKADPLPSPVGTPVLSPAPAGTEAEFSADARLLYKVVACGDGDPLPPNLSAPVVQEHCKWMRPRMDRYRQQYAKLAKPFLAGVRPAGLPQTVVYPFGGGDLLSAITTYPEASEIDTISLELAGDPRRLPHLKKQQLEDSLALIRGTIGGLLTQTDSTSESLMKTQQGDLPGELSFFLVALAVYDLEPVSLRYFRIAKDGSLHYLTKEDIAAVEKKTAHRRKGSWTSPDFSEAFANSELSFRPRGAAPGAPLQLHRHIGANLGDDALKKDAALLLYLQKKGRVSAMTKAASYCLWNPNFTRIRDYLLANMDFMVSDSTGIPPEFATKAGFIQEPYGSFSGSFLEASPTYNEEFKKLWAKSPHRSLPFRYGYLDATHSYHLIVTRRAPAAGVGG
jgi:hypothetical protein